MGQIALHALAPLGWVDREFHPTPYWMPKADIETTIFALAKLVATLAKRTVGILQNRKLDLLDPIVHENSCQIRALFAIRACDDAELLGEAEGLVEEAKRIEKSALTLLSKVDTKKLVMPQERMMIADFVRAFKVTFVVSEKMLFLMRAHFLTTSKVYQVKRDGSEVCYINLDKLCGDFGTRQLAVKPLIEQMVDRAQRELGVSSIQFIQRVARGLAEPFGEEGAFVSLQLEDRNIRNISKASRLHERCSCAFFNLKAILMDLSARRTLVIVKPHVVPGQEERKTKHPKAPFGLCFRTREAGGPLCRLVQPEVEALDPRETAFVVQGLMPRDGVSPDELADQIERVGGLQEMVLCNVARTGVPQFGVASVEALPEDAPAREELEEHRARAGDLGCTDRPDQRRLFTVIHTFASSVRGELDKIETLVGGRV